MTDTLTRPPENDTCGDPSKDNSKPSTITSLISRSENLCVRHQRMADEGANARLQKSIDGLSLDEKEAVNTVWSLFSSSPHSRRALILRGLLTMCCSSQLSLLASEVAMAVRMDPFSLFPREVSLRILGYLDAISLGRAAQVSRLWRSLADNDLLWRNMCEQHIERKCEKCGWGLPRLPDNRGRTGDPTMILSSSTSTKDDEYRKAASAVSDGNLRRTITAAANAAAIEKRKNSVTRESSRSCSPCEDDHEKKRVRTSSPITRPWKAVYCERLAIERNWRYGRYRVQVLRGHTEGIMCLAFREKLSQLPYPVLVTGGYDRTIRVWNLATGETLRVLTGHARGVRCLQFDDVKLITGSMDRTLKIWNWRTGELLRTLEGHTEGIVSLCFDDNILVSGSADSNIRVWNFHTGECFPLDGHRDWVNALQLWSGHNQLTKSLDMFLFSASDDFTVRLWDLQHRESIMVFRGHVGQVQSIKVVTMDVSTIRKLARGSTRVLGTTEYDSDSSDEGGTPKGQATPLSTSFTSQAADVSNLPEHFFQSAGPSTRRATSSHARRIPSTLVRVHERLSAAGLVPALSRYSTLADVEDGIFDGSEDDKEAVPSCKTKRPVLVSGSLDNTLKLWDIRTGRCFYTLFGHVEGVWCVDVDTLRIVSASHDRTIKIWDRDTGQCQTTLVGHRRAVTTCALGDDKIISGSDDGDVRVWSFCPPRDAPA
ncbi:wd40 repeat-like protein [Malassezia pachydermatis]|uniref:Wd40 repeat-like protein n=1 Tax=Malassezia pachydermatis TaxID=77020 RepID=A0A0M8MT58_9BASI|nr:wd40 repeat-like protein [Malassezia pachydermatis]KOS13270.1 wd40 repeat-like protein [Malassezia pachydermatis]